MNLSFLWPTSITIYNEWSYCGLKLIIYSLRVSYSSTLVHNEIILLSRSDSEPVRESGELSNDHVCRHQSSRQ